MSDRVKRPNTVSTMSGRVNRPNTVSTMFGGVNRPNYQQSRHWPLPPIAPVIPPPPGSSDGSNHRRSSSVQFQEHEYEHLQHDNVMSQDRQKKLSVGNPSDTYSLSEPRACDSHAGRSCHNYCLNHDCLVCLTCIENAHVKCLTPDLETVAAEIRQVSERILFAIDKDLLGSLKSSINKAKEHSHSLSQKAERLAETVNNHAEQLIKQINIQREKTLTDLKVASQKAIQQTDLMVEGMESQFVALQKEERRYLQAVQGLSVFATLQVPHHLQEFFNHSMNNSFGSFLQYNETYSLDFNVLASDLSNIPKRLMKETESFVGKAIEGQPSHNFFRQPKEKPLEEDIHTVKTPELKDHLGKIKEMISKWKTSPVLKQ